MIRKTLLLGTPLSATLSASLISQNSDEKQSLKKSMISKASELPIYTSLISDEKKCEKKSSKLVETIEEGSKIVRTELTKVTDVYDSQKAVIERYYVSFMKDTQHIRNYLQEEDNSLPRVGAIFISSLAGFVLGGVRGGFFRKIFYASITGSGMASVCYPREAKKYVTIAYNFAYGKSPNDSNQKDIPKFPTTFDEVKDQVTILSQKAYDAVFKK
ncbi:unnamed protein product [Chironomus riparius]|uniref:MICOS complex subunit n=1 Tax=Chironomus riparius TaxID=315576 RepID=A0A9N9WPP2_9DIPT|nr:unnamed protein product [Chironomus riparius]